MNALRQALARIEAVAPAHSTAPVPASDSVPAYRVTLVCLGISFTLTSLYIGSELALSLGLAQAIRAVLLGSAVLAVLSIPAALVGAHTRLSTYMIVRQVFGQGGALLVNVLLGTALLGWYAVTAELFGRTCYLELVGRLPWVPQGMYTIACSVLVIVTTVVGFKAIDRLSLAAAPLLIALTAFVAWRTLGVHPWAELLTVPAAKPDFPQGVAAVIGGMIVGVLLMPDITRYSRSMLDCVAISVVGNGGGNAGSLLLGLIPALAFHERDPMRYLVSLGLAGVGFTILVISTWTINAVNLYSTGLVTSAALQRGRYAGIVLGCGIVGTTLAVIGVADRLMQFLGILGVIVPPVASVYITDFFILRRRDLSDLRSTRTNVSALIAAVAGAVIGITLQVSHASLTGVPTIESFVSAALVYLLAEALRQRTGRNRAWGLASREA